MAENNALRGRVGPPGIPGAKGERGPQGEKGASGADGKTPVKGVDYFTPDEKTEIAAEAAGMVHIPVDDSLTMNGQAADAKATGDALRAVSAENAELKQDKADKTALARTDRSLDALWKLNQGISYQFEQDNTESYQKTVPSGAKLASIEQIGGNAEVIDSQLVSADVTEVTEQGKNLFDLTSFVQSMPEYYAISDGGLIIKKAYSSVSVPNLLTLPMGDYYISVPNTTRIQVIANGKVLKDHYYTKGLSFTITEESNVTFRFMSPDSGGANYPYPHNAGLVQLEKGAARTDYAPYRCNRYPIPDAVRNLPGYGWSAGEVCNSIERTGDGLQYVQRVGSRAYQEGDIVTDGVTTYYALENPIITDITDLMDGVLDALPVESGGTLTFENAARLDVPNAIEYAVKLSEVSQ